METIKKDNISEMINPDIWASARFDKGFFIIPEAFIAEFQRTVPWLDLPAVMKKCAGWINRKVAKGEFSTTPALALQRFIIQAISAGEAKQQPKVHTLEEVVAYFTHPPELKELISQTTKGKYSQSQWLAKNELEHCGINNLSIDIYRLLRGEVKLCQWRYDEAPDLLRQYIYLGGNPAKFGYIAHFDELLDKYQINKAAEIQALIKEGAEKAAEQAKIDTEADAVLKAWKAGARQRDKEREEAEEFLKRGYIIIPEGVGIEHHAGSPSTIIDGEVVEAENVEATVDVMETGEIEPVPEELPKKKPDGLTIAEKIRHYDNKQKIARMDRGFGLSDLFYHVPQGSERRYREDIAPQLFDGHKITITAPDMGEFEQSLLLAYMMIASNQKDIITELGSADERLVAVPTVIINKKEVANPALSKSTCAVRTGISKVLKAVDMDDSSQNRTYIKAAHKRLCATVIEVKDLSTGNIAITNLISGTIGSGHESFCFRLNYRLTEVLLMSGAAGGGGYTKINMNERFSLPKGPARLLYTYLCVTGLDNIGSEAAMRHVYGQPLKLSKNPDKKEKNRVRQELLRRKKTMQEAVNLISELPGFKSRNLSKLLA